MSEEIVQLTFVVADARRHTVLEFFHRENLDSHIDLSTYKESDVLYKKVTSYKRVFPELNFDVNPIFHKIRLVVRANRSLTRSEDFRFLLSWGHRHRLYDEFRVRRYPI